MTANGRMARAEKFGFRHEDISLRHRVWGFDCPAVDIDFLVVEYNLGKPVAIVDYKSWWASAPSFAHPTYRAISWLADCAAIPFFVAWYWPTSWTIRVEPVNEHARTWFLDGEVFSERAFAEQLYEMRGRVVQEEVLSKLNSEISFDEVPF